MWAVLATEVPATEWAGGDFGSSRRVGFMIEQLFVTVAMLATVLRARNAAKSGTPKLSVAARSVGASNI
jgi:hypothetical protein